MKHRMNLTRRREVEIVGYGTHTSKNFERPIEPGSQFVTRAPGEGLLTIRLELEKNNVTHLKHLMSTLRVCRPPHFVLSHKECLVVL